MQGRGKGESASVVRLHSTTVDIIGIQSRRYEEHPFDLCSYVCDSQMLTGVQQLVFSRPLKQRLSA